MARKVYRRASPSSSSLLAEMKGVSTSIPPIESSLDETIVEICSTAIPASEYVERLITSEQSSWTPNEFSAVCGRPDDIAAVLYHSGFIRAAARRGFAFFLGADRRIYRFGIKSNEVVVKSSTPPNPVVGTSCYFKPPWYDDLKHFIEVGEPVLLIGPPGAGKTEACERIFAERGQTLHIVSCNPSMTADDLEGRVELRNEGGVMVTKFEMAPLALASRDGHGILLDEADAIPAAASFGLFRLLDGKDMRILRLGLEGVVPRHANLRLVGTQNTEGRGDDRGLHHGRAYQDEAFLDRWGNYIRVDYPEPDIESAILQSKTGVDRADAGRVVESATLLRRALKEDSIMFCCSMRRTIAVCKNLHAGRAPRAAWSYAVLNRATPEDARIMEEILQRVYGGLWTR